MAKSVRKFSRDEIPAQLSPDPCRSRSMAFFSLSASARSMSFCICSAVRLSPFACLKSTFNRMVRNLEVHASLRCCLGSQLDRTKLRSIKGLIRTKHGKQRVKKFTHNRYDCLETCFATPHQTLIESLQMRLPAHGHVPGGQGLPQPAAQRTFFHRST